MDEVRRVMRLVPLVAVLFALALGTMPANVLAVSDYVRVAPDGQVRTLEGSFGQVEALVPGFGGMFLDGDTLKIYLTNPSQKAAAIRAISAVFGVERIPVGGVQVLQATYGFAQLSQWHNRMGVLFQISGVILTDIDESANRLKVGVVSSTHFVVVEVQLARLGIPRGAVDIVVMEPIVFAATLRDRIRPIEGGIQIAFGVYACTLGFNGIRSSVEGFVVNSHCTDKQGGVEDTKHYQPTVATDNFIGTEIADPLYTKEKCPPGTRGKVCRYSDSAYDRRDSGVTANLGFIARPDGVNTGSLTIAGTFRIVSEGPSVKGDVVNKVGRTTGWTQGKVTDTCVNVSVLGSRIMQRCQDIVSAGVGGGDSGSPVFALASGDDVQLRGILWGGNMSGTVFVYSPIANIERIDELGPITTCASGFTC